MRLRALERGKLYEFHSLDNTEWEEPIVCNCFSCRLLIRGQLQSFSDIPKGALIIATTIVTQKVAGEMLKREGFSVLKAFHNPNSGNEVQLWGKVAA